MKQHFLAAALFGQLCVGYEFAPESQSTYKTNVPTLFDFTDSQYELDKGSSWWMSSFITGDNDKQYLAISHALTEESPESPDAKCRSSILDLESLDYWVDLSYCNLQGNTAFDRSSPMHADFGTHGFKATSNDSVSSMNAYVQTSNFSMDISWGSTSTALLNGGNGVIAFGSNYGNATEWSIPSCKTTGNITLNDEVINIDTKGSFTWYDRQIAWATPRNWTWFQVNFPNSPVKASVWAMDLDASGNQLHYASVRADGDSQHILSYKLSADMSQTWTSPNSNITYPLSWRLDFDNGDYLKVKSVRDDQEMFGYVAVSDSAYEGFVTIEGKFLGQTQGFGIVEMVRVY